MRLIMSHALVRVRVVLRNKTLRLVLSLASLLVTLVALHATVGLFPGVHAAPPAFTSGNLVVYRVGTGSGALASSATAVFLDEYTTAGTFVQTIAMPTTDSGANQTLTASGTATSEG